MAGNESSFSEPPEAPEAPGGEAAASPRGGDKRERILQAAIRVFAEKGFYATRVSEIARAAGVADGTIYLYFKNKDAVLVSIFEERLRALIDLLRAELAACDGVEARIRRIVEVQLGLLEGQRDLAEVLTVNLRQSSMLLKQYATPLFREYLQVVADVIADGQSRGVLRADLAPLTVARALWGALDGLALTWALGSADPASLRKAAQQTAEVFLGGVRAA